MKILHSILIFGLVLSLLLMGRNFLSPVLAADSFLETLEEAGEQTPLPSYEQSPHAQAIQEPGVKSITSVAFYLVDFIKYFVGSIAVLFIIIHGIKLITAARGVEEKSTKEKQYITYGIIGLLVIFASTELVKTVFYGKAGEFLESEETAATFAQAGIAEARGIYNFIEIFIGVFAILTIILSGFQMLIGGIGGEDVITKARKRIMYSCIGLVIIGLSEAVVKDVIFKDYGTVLGVSEGKILFAQVTNFAASVIGFVAVGMLIYGGYHYLLYMGNEQMTEKAKKILLGAVIGIVIAAGAFALTSTIIPLEAG